MLNSSVYNNFSYNINAVSGTLRKSHPKSRFCVREVDKDVFVFDSERPRLFVNTGEVVVLQIMLTGENVCIVEYVNKADFESEDNFVQEPDKTIYV